MLTIREKLLWNRHQSSSIFLENMKCIWKYILLHIGRFVLDIYLTATTPQVYWSWDTSAFWFSLFFHLLLTFEVARLKHDPTCEPGIHMRLILLKANMHLRLHAKIYLVIAIVLVIRYLFLFRCQFCSALFIHITNIWYFVLHNLLAPIICIFFAPFFFLLWCLV